MALLLGIDTGGTYTDAVLYRPDRGVLASAKALTTREDLALGIDAAAGRVLPEDPGRVAMVSISTTLATNAIVEGQGAPVCLLLIGQGPEALPRSGLGAALGGDPVAFVAGGHDATGAELCPLDEAAIAQAVARHADTVSAFAVTAHFAVRNAAHEARAHALVREHCDRPVTCSQDLSERLDAPRRALTTVLNARLIPMIADLIAAVERMMERRGLNAPLMVVKGDGSLVQAGLARQRPVETILSGPAASIVGGHHLAEAGDALVVDMGGTTSDIAVLERGRPRLRDDGASVGGWRTMVRAVAAHTVGLGGDSEVQVGKDGARVGPRRVVPMSLLVQQRPELLDVLERRCERMLYETDQVRLVMLAGPAPPVGQLTRFERELTAELSPGPRWVSDIASDRVLLRVLERLLRRGLVTVSAFTPTDAAHVLGLQRTWSPEGARAAAELWRRLALDAGAFTDPDLESFCRWVLDALTLSAGHAVVTAALAHEDAGIETDSGPARSLVSRALGGGESGTRLLNVALRLERPLVAVGAPAASYFPPVAERLSATLRVPRHAEVANAVGAVAAGVLQSARVLISAPSSGCFRVHAGAEVRDFSAFRESLTHARSRAIAIAREKARAAGADDVHVETEQQDLRAPGTGGEEIFIETSVTATALGRPNLERLAGGAAPG